MKKYDYKKVEKKWQKFWEKNKPFRAEDGNKKEKYYYLVEFPYPSGEGLHVGHVRSYTALDIMARKKRIQGFNVLYPIGWDAFGLPAENYAIKTGKHPKKVTEENVKVYKNQIQSLGISFDWDREINTTDPEYYKWTQWIFLQLYKKGLAYKKKMPINWCPSCKIGLANEEVVDGKCERCDAEAEKKEMEQWMLKITEYADRLIEDLETVDYLDKIKTQQINWIGRSEGSDIDFEVKDFDDRIKVFTTRPDTLFGATFMVLSPEHELVNKITTSKQEKEVIKYQEQAGKKSDLERTELQKEKTGVFTGAYAINPVNKKKIPIWIADYVLASYGYGAIMAVPAHDQRDFEFANKYKLEIEQVISPMFIDDINPPQEGFDEVCRDTVLAFVRDIKTKKYALLDWHGTLDGITTTVMGGIDDGEDPEKAARKELAEEAGLENVTLIKKSNWITEAKYCASHKKENRHAKAHAFLFEVENLDKQKEIPEKEQKIHTLYWVKEDEVEGKLVPPHQKFVWQQILEETALTQGGHLMNSGKYDGMNVGECIENITKWLDKQNLGKKATNYHLRDWVFSRQHYWGEPIPMVYCEVCGWVPLKEEDLPLELPMVEKYLPTDTGESPLASIEDWVKTTCPKCKGKARRETDTMPNWAGSSWYFLRYIDPKNTEQFADMDKLKYWTPVDLYNGGMEHTTLHLLYSRFWHKFLYDQGLVPTSEPYQRRVSHGMILAPDNQKMSKSRGNVINPDEIVNEYGADTLRIYEMFMGPYDQPVSWDTNGLRGVKKFLDKVWASRDKQNKQDSKEVVALLHKTIQKVTEDIDKMHFNTAVSAMMIFVNKIQETGCTKETFEKFIILLSPFAPHLAEELFSALGEKGSVAEQSWPSFDKSKVASEQIEIPVQVNGKIRDKLSVSADISEAELKKLALDSEKVQKFLEGKKPKKVIYVKGRLLSIVV